MISQATVIETGRVEVRVQGDFPHDRRWEPVATVRADRRERPNRTLSEWLAETQPVTGTYRLLTSWGARSDEIPYRSEAA